MTNKLMKIFTLLLLFSAFTFVGCSDDDNLTGNSVDYELNERNDSGIDGDIEFEELDNGKIQIQISLSGTESGTTHPAHIHMNSAALGGSILISLDPVDGATGSSVTIVDKTDLGDDLTFGMIGTLDAYVNVHKSASDLETIVAQGDIGGNVLTGESVQYTLNEKAIDGIKGSITFKQRKNGFTLAEIELDGTPDNGMHPAHIHANSAAETGDVIVDLSTVDGNSGKSLTDIRVSKDGNILDYEDILTLNGYVNVHLSDMDLSTIVAQGDIGLNALTGESVTYNLDERDVPGISGEIIFEERLDGSFKATIDLDGTPSNGKHPAHIHENSFVEGGAVVLTFNPVDGATGKSITSVRQYNDGSPFTFQAVKNYDGYVNVHLSENDLGTIVSQGNIGINN